MSNYHIPLIFIVVLKIWKKTWCHSKQTLKGGLYMYSVKLLIRSTIMEKNNSFDQWILLILNHLWTVPTTRPPSLIKTMCSRRLKLQESRCIFLSPSFTLFSLNIKGRVAFDTPWGPLRLCKPPKGHQHKMLLGQKYHLHL